jgi:hypothetical protein
MEQRSMRVGERITGKYKDMVLDHNNKAFKLSLGDQEIYLPKPIGDSILERGREGLDTFTLQRTRDVYRIAGGHG